MFDFSSGELLLIAVAALIFIKPKDLPGVLRAIGQWTGKIRRMAGEFQDQFREAIREAEVADLKKDIDEATSGLNEKLDPFAGIDTSTEWKPSEPAAPAVDTAPPAADTAPATQVAEVAAEAAAAPSAPAQPVPAERAEAAPVAETADAAPAAGAPAAPPSGGQPA